MSMTFLRTRNSETLGLKIKQKPKIWFEGFLSRPVLIRNTGIQYFSGITSQNTDEGRANDLIYNSLKKNDLKGS